MFCCVNYCNFASWNGCLMSFVWSLLSAVILSACMFVMFSDILWYTLPAINNSYNNSNLNAVILIFIFSIPSNSFETIMRRCSDNISFLSFDFFLLSFMLFNDFFLTFSTFDFPFSLLFPLIPFRAMLRVYLFFWIFRHHHYFYYLLFWLLARFQAFLLRLTFFHIWTTHDDFAHAFKDKNSPHKEICCAVSQR